MGDNTLQQLFSGLPSPSVVLIEDIDRAFGGVDLTQKHTQSKSEFGQNRGSSVTLAGLLNAIDGIAAQEGRLLFATTNNPTVLEPAFLRPGRIDRQIQFDLAKKDQIAELVKHFYQISQKSKQSPTKANQDGMKKGTVKNSKPMTELNFSFGDYEFKTYLGTKKTSEKSHFELLGDEEPGKEPCDEANALVLSADDISHIAGQVAHAVPEDEFSPADIQNLLMHFRNSTKELLEYLPMWVDSIMQQKRLWKMAHENSLPASNPPDSDAQHSEVPATAPTAQSKGSEEEEKTKVETGGKPEVGPTACATASELEAVKSEPAKEVAE